MCWRYRGYLSAPIASRCLIERCSRCHIHCGLLISGAHGLLYIVTCLSGRQLIARGRLLVDLLLLVLLLLHLELLLSLMELRVLVHRARVNQRSTIVELAGHLTLLGSQSWRSAGGAALGSIGSHHLLLALLLAWLLLGLRLLVMLVRVVLEQRARLAR